MFTGWNALLGVGVLALAWAWAPATAGAETLWFRNDSKVPVVVQGACVIDGKVRRDQPMPVQPGGVVKVVLPGNKQITVFEGRPPNLPLFQGTLPASREDQFFSMQPDPTNGKMRIDRVKPPNVP
jgi:hypothetical protein